MKKFFVFVLLIVCFCKGEVSHSGLTGTNIHTVYRWIFADSAARVNQTVVDADTMKLALQKSDSTSWILMSTTGTKWKKISFASNQNTLTTSNVSFGKVSATDSVKGTAGKFTDRVTGTDGDFSDSVKAVTGTFSGAIIGTTLNTGNGANELYPMNQGVRNTDSTEFVATKNTRSYTALAMINPTGTNYNEGVRISPSTTSGYSSVSFGTKSDSIGGYTVGQWAISRGPASQVYKFGIYYMDKQKFTFDTNGYFGINNLSPSYPLHVVGSANKYTVYFYGNGTTGQSFGQKVQAGTTSSDQAFGIYSYANLPYFTIRGDGPTSAWFAFSAPSVGTDSLLLSGSDAFKVYDTGSFACTLSTDMVTSEQVGIAKYTVIGNQVTIRIPPLFGNGNFTDSTSQIHLNVGGAPSIVTACDSSYVSVPVFNGVYSTRQAGTVLITPNFTDLYFNTSTGQQFKDDSQYTGFPREHSLPIQNTDIYVKLV